jgi:hypothetical protein
MLDGCGCQCWWYLVVACFEEEEEDNGGCQCARPKQYWLPVFVQWLYAGSRQSMGLCGSLLQHGCPELEVIPVWLRYWVGDRQLLDAAIGARASCATRAMPAAAQPARPAPAPPLPSRGPCTEEWLALEQNHTHTHMHTYANRRSSSS